MISSKLFQLKNGTHSTSWERDQTSFASRIFSTKKCKAHLKQLFSSPQYYVDIVAQSHLTSHTCHWKWPPFSTLDIMDCSSFALSMQLNTWNTLCWLSPLQFYLQFTSPILKCSARQPQVFLPTTLNTIFSVINSNCLAQY